MSPTFVEPLIRLYISPPKCEISPFLNVIFPKVLVANSCYGISVPRRSIAPNRFPKVESLLHNSLATTTCRVQGPPHLQTAVALSFYPDFVEAYAALQAFTSIAPNHIVEIYSKEDSYLRVASSCILCVSHCCLALHKDEASSCLGHYQLTTLCFAYWSISISSI